MPARPRKRDPEWVDCTDEELLDLRFCDLKLKIDGTWLEEMVDRLHQELEYRSVRIRPHCWLSVEWFSPDGVPGIAIPFYLAHPRLMKLERRQMLEVEGGTRQSCMRILRHEAGHAIDTAYRLRRRRAFKEVFGRAGIPYPETYAPHPHSREYVLHLDWWYAQSHPVEDFSETFAVWLKPDSRWRKSYRGWPALKKLQFVDRLMKEIADQPAPVRVRERTYPLSQVRRTLRTHYRAKRNRYGIDLPDVYDRALKTLFTEGGRRKTAYSFLRRVKSELRDQIAQWTGQHPYTIEQFVNEMATSARALDLRLARSERQTRLDVAVLLTVQVMDYVREGGRRHVL